MMLAGSTDTRRDIEDQRKFTTQNMTRHTTCRHVSFFLNALSNELFASVMNAWITASAAGSFAAFTKATRTRGTPIAHAAIWACHTTAGCHACESGEHLPQRFSDSVALSAVTLQRGVRI